MRIMIVSAALLTLMAAGCRKAPEKVEINTEGTEAIPAEISTAGLKEVLPQAWLIHHSDTGWKFDVRYIKDWIVEPTEIRFSYPRFKDPITYRFGNVVRFNLKTNKKLWNVEMERLMDGKKSTVTFYYREKAPAQKAIELLDSLRRKAD